MISSQLLISAKFASLLKSHNFLQISNAIYRKMNSHENNGYLPLILFLSDGKCSSD